MSIASPVGTKPYLHSRGWIRPASCPSPPSTAGTSSDLSEYTSCISHPEAILQLQAFAESLTYRLMCQRINILKATLNQGWWELADPSPSFLATLLLAVGQLWAKSQQSLEGPQQDGNSVDPRGSIIILLIWHPAIISLGIRTKTRKMQLQTALLFEYHDHFVLTILLGRRKEIDTSSRKYSLFIWPRNHLQWNHCFRFCFWGKSKPRQTHISVHHVYSWGRQWHPTPVLLPGKSHGWRSLVGCSPWGR